MMKKTINHRPTDKQLDALWKKACLLRDGFTCQYTLDVYHTRITRDHGVLQVHHVMKKATNRLRWDLDNGVTVTKGVHFGTAHSQKPIVEYQFREWALSRLPAARRKKLELAAMAKKTGGVDRIAVKIYLEKKIAEYSRHQQPKGGV